MELFKPKLGSPGQPPQGGGPVEPIDATQKGVKQTLPELELREIQKSAQPINREGGSKRKVETIRPWNNYTIVTLEGSDEIQIFNEDAKLIEDFKPPLSSKKIVVDWSDQNIEKKIGRGHISSDPQYISNASVLMLDKIPLELRGFAKKALVAKRIISFGNSHFFTEMIASELTILSDKYVVLTANEGGFFTYITKNDKGITLAPKDWKRLNPNDELPVELKNEVEKLLGENEGYKQLNGSHYVLITDVGINIFKKENDQGTPVFSEDIPSVERNMTVDPSNPSVVFYCQSSNPRSVMRLDLNGESNTWKPVAAEFPKKYESVRNLQLDPTGNFFLFYSKDDLVIVTKDELQEVKRVPNLTQVNFDSTGRIRAVDKDGYLVIYEPNFTELAQEMDKHRVARLAEGIKIVDIFTLEASKKALEQKGGAGLEYLEPLRTQYEQQFIDVLAKITTQEGVQQLRQGFGRLAQTLKQQGLKPNEVSFIIAGLEAPIQVKEKEFAVKGAGEALTFIRAKLASGLSITSVGEARAEMERVKAIEALLETDLRQEVREVAQELEQRSLEFFRQRGGEIIKDISGLIERTRIDLEGFTSKMQMDNWLEHRYPELRLRLGSLANDVPQEADEAYKAIVAARMELQTIASIFEDKFKREYAKVREKASERIGATVDILAQDVDGLIDRLRNKGFTSRTAAEQYLSSSEAKKALETEIAGLAGDNPDVAKELERGLKVRLSNALTEIERGALTQVAETGQQMVLFGQTAFPKWEAKVKEKGERKVEVIFEEDAKSHGPGVNAGDILGDVSISIRTSSGKIEQVRLYEGWQDENEWRLGLLTYRGESIPPSYLTAKEFKDIKKAYGDWSKGEKSKLQKELQEKRKALRELYAKREKEHILDANGKKIKIAPRTAEGADIEWQKEYRKALQDYAKFAAEHHISLLRRIDQVKDEPEIELSNGHGEVPEWKRDWIRDAWTESYLEKMALLLQKQSELQAGILMLKGHAGTGKDVLVDMFCEATRRPKFSFNCSKWTQEADLSEDWTLVSEDGASHSLTIPSAILSGIQTPGAVVYLNEYTAMPEPSQIFLHSLTDGKRAMYLKSKSGKVVRAHPTVLIIGSENPGYSGTTPPQEATRSRWDELQVLYPPLNKDPSPEDKNRNKIITAYEALRIARSVDSLMDITLEGGVTKNEFEDVWDKYINGIDNSAPELTTEQKFDCDVVLALVQFSDQLRTAYINIFEKTREAKKYMESLPATQPMTGREMLSCAWWLNRMTKEEKVTANPENVARRLLEETYLQHIDSQTNQDKIRTAMNTWTSKKRVRA